MTQPAARRPVFLFALAVAALVPLAWLLQREREPEPTELLSATAAGSASAVAPALPSTSSAAPSPPPPGALPASERVFGVTLGGARVVLGAHHDTLWAASLETEPPTLLFRTQGVGAVQLLAAGDYGRGDRLYVARGRSLALRSAPLSLMEVEPTTGQETALWRHDGPRNEATHLSVADANGDGQPDLAFAYFATKHDVEPRHLTASGDVLGGDAVRMATTRAYADVDGDGVTDEIVGRMYGDDERETAGHLRVRLGERWVEVPTDRGVRTLAVFGGAIYFGDGWAKNYGRDARAQLKRARWVDGAFTIDVIGRSADEYTFFAMEPFEAGGRTHVIAIGDRRATRFSEGGDGVWSAHVMRARVKGGHQTNVAVLSAGEGCVLLLVPSAPSTHLERLCPGAAP